MESIENKNLVIHNTDTFSHIDKTSKSNIDLILSSTDIADKINVQVYPDTWGSDHYPMLISINIEKNCYEKKSLKLQSKKKKLEKFSLTTRKYVSQSHFTRIRFTNPKPKIPIFCKYYYTGRYEKHT